MKKENNKMSKKHTISVIGFTVAIILVIIAIFVCFGAGIMANIKGL